MHRKMLSYFFALAVATGAFLAHAEIVGEDTARAAAEGFLAKSQVANTILAGRSVDSVEAYGSLWIVRLAPSGYIELAGSTKCAPILSFSENDFTEPEVDSPLAAKLSSDTLMVEAKEADEDAADNADWTKYTAPVAKKRTLLAAKPTGTDGTGYDHFVAPLLGATWNQTAPFNDLSPYNYFCGCMATAAGQELRYWRWPYRYEKFRQTTHGVRDAQFNYSDFVLRPNGLVPFNWDKVVASAPNPASTPWAADKEATYNTAWLSLWAQSLTGMGYKPGGSGGTRQLAGTAEDYWYEKGKGMTYWSDGYTNLWNAIKADLDWGSPIQINTAAHQMVIDGYAVENYGKEDEVDWINLNLGYGNAVYWDNLKTAVTEGTYSGTLASFQTGFRPQKIVQFEPVPKVCSNDVTLVWHMAPCYTNRTTGFTLEVAKAGGASNTIQIETHGETTTYTASGLEMGGEYTFSVCPVMVDGEGTGRTNSVATTIGAPKAAPEFLNVSSVACGIELLQQDVFIECAYGSVNKIELTCSESTTEVVPYSSHLTILPDSQLSVSKNGSVFTVNVDATEMDPKWSGEMLVLTLVAKNDDGTEAYKNLMLRFNSMRQVINGTFDAADGDSNSAVWFCGDTTIDAKGKAVSFGADAFQGTGKVTLKDSVGGGSFTFASLDNFKGTLVFTGNCSVTLPEDMTGFSGTLKLTSGTYNLSSDFTSDATIILDGAANDYESVVVNLNSVNLGATVTGWGTINISSGECTFAKTIASNSTLVRLTGGTLTTPADDSDYCYVQMVGGTLKVNITEAQTQLGYKWKLPLYQSGDIKFVLSDGTEEDVTVVVEGGLATISHDTDANIWTGTEYWNNSNSRYSDTTKWSKGVLPENGDYVIFNSAGNGDEGMNGYGTAMVLNLPSAVNLGYVQVRGDSGLEITTVSGISTAVLKVGVLENQVMTKIKATEFQPEIVIPKRTLYIAYGNPLTCDLEYRYADNLKQSNSSESALRSSDYWHGTVLLSNQSINNFEISNYGNAQSKIRFNGVTGSLMGGKTFDGTLELVDYDGAPALNLNAGSSNYGVTIGAVAGSGMFKTSGSASTLNILLKDISDWTGSFDLASKTVAIGSSIPSSYTGNDGRLHICQAATVADGATWKADGGLYLGAGGALTVNGAVEAKNVTTYGAGASLTLEDGAVLQVSAASVNDNVPTLNFEAGTFRVKEGSDAFRETATINFCAASGKRTVIDANGATLTLGPNVFSGAGDVCLTSSKEGGKIIVKGVSADYSGTIFCDISCEVSLGDLSKASNCNINVSDIIISRSSSDIGNLTIGAGASLEVTVNKQSLIDGCTIDTVTLVDGGTMVLKDKTGQEITTFTASDAVDGKYVLEPDPDVTVECLLDYEFNGNMNSTGTDTTGLTIWNGTASYDSESQKIKMNCKPYINKTFAMPDDEWSTFIRCTLPAANGESPTMVLMFGKNGGSVFGLVAGAGENTVALASKDGLIGEAVQVDDATTTQHVYAIVKTANRVRLYVDGVLKVDESATVSVSKEFQIGSVKNGNNTSYSPCEDANALIDYLKFYDFAVGDNFEEMVYSGPKPVAVWDGDFSSSELTKFSGYELVDWNKTHGENNSSVTIDRANQGLMFRSSTGLSGITVLVRYSNLTAGSNKRVLFTSTINSNHTGTRTGIRLASGTAGTLRGLSGNADWDDSRNPESGSVNESGVMAFTYSSAGTYLYKGSSLDDMAEAWGCSSLKWSGDTVYGAGIGGYCEGASANGYEAAQGMTITAIAVFDSALTASVLQDYRWPSEASEEPEEPEPTLTVSPASGAVAAGTTMTVTCSDPTATIWYKKYVTGEEEYVEYTEPVALDTGYNFVYVKVNDGEATMYTYFVAAPEPEPEPDYEGPAPIAVWVAGEFDDDKSAHGGLEFALNGNATNALGEIVIGTTTTLGAEVGIPAGHSIASVLVKYSIPDGEHVDNSVLASMFSAYDLGVLSDSGESTGKGYWYTGSVVSDGSYAFSNPAPSIPQDGYLLLSYKHNSSTAAYLGSTISTLAGGSNGSLHFSNNDVTKMAFGGPTVAAAKPWAGMVIKSVAIFLDEYLSAADLANYKFPAQGAVKPEDSDRYVVEPVASWVNDFKTLTKGDYTLSVSGTTAAKDDTFGGTLTIGDAAAIIDTTAANSTKMTVLIKYRAASSVVNASVVAFGGTAPAFPFDIGVYTKSDKTLAVYRNFNTDNTKPYDFGTAPVLSATGGYVLCARDNGQQCMAYVGESLDSMTGGTVSNGGIKFSNVVLTKLGIGGNSGLPANANDMVPFAGLEIEKIVVFNGYYTPDQVRYIPNPEDGDTVNIADNTTWTFTASDTPREYLNIGTLSSSGTIAIANASELEEGTYPLATWSTPQQYTTQCAGYGKVGNLVTDGLAAGLSARLIYGARAIYLRVDDTAKKATRKPLVVWCYGDSITEGYNAQATGANYRILLYQKLEMLGYNVRSTGVYGLSNGYNSVDPSGTALTDQYRWHSAKHGATAAPSSLSHRSNLSESVDTLAIQAGTPDVALLLIGVNDLPQFSTVEPVFKGWTNVVTRLVNNLPDTKIIVSTILYSNGKRGDDLDERITDINNNYIKPLMADMPEEWQGHVVLADLNSWVKSTDPGIIYSDKLHPDWWGYDQMADGYLAKIVECYPNPDATNFPSQNPIPDAPTVDQLGAANKPELAAYREGFTKLCNIRVEKGQDVSDVVYDDVNNDAASENLEKVGYFVEFVRADNHAHKWVWVDMDAFGDADLASVGLPQRNYQQAVTRMHVCSNHGAIDNVAADDDSVTGWIEFSPYDYTRAASNSAAPANYGEPFDWNDTLSESGSYGCMQVFRVMNPSSRDLYERPQLMFAFNNFQSQNSNPADFGIGNFAQHFNCNNSYHTEDWTGVGGTLAKMAPDQYSVKTIEIWTKENDSAYSGPEPAAVWVAGEFDDDRSAHGGCEFALNGNTTNALGQIVIGNSTTLGATIAVPNYDNATMLVKYEIPSGGAPAANSVPASVFVTKEMGAIAGSGSSALDGYWLNGSSITAGYAFSSAAPSIPQEGYLLISVPANSNQNPGNHYTAAYVGETVSALSGGETSGLRFTGDNNRVTSIGVGGPTVAGAVPWAGMVIKGVALFDSWLTPDDIKGYQFPEQGAVQPQDSDRYVVEPVASWVNDFKTTEKNGCTLSVSGTTAAKDDAFGGTLTIGDAAAIIDTTAANSAKMTVLIKYRAASSVVSAPVVAFGGMAAVGLDVGVYTKSDKTLAVYRNFSTDNTKPYDFGTAPQLSATGGYVLCARDNGQQCMTYVGDSLDTMTGGTVSDGGIKFSNITLTKLGIGGNSGMAANANDMVPFAGLEIEKIVVFNGYYTPDQIRYVENPEDGDTVNIADNTTWKFAATATPREYTNIGTLSSSGTIAITNASELAEGTYTLATWTTAQKKSTGYGRVGTLDTTGLPAGLSAELVYGARAIYLRVWNPTTQADKGTIKVWPYGDSITEGFNAGGTKANYRVLLAQKLSMLGYNVEMVGCYDKINNAEGIDPSGQAIPDAWKWHSAKHGATAGPTTSAAGRANLCENVDTLCAQASNPDVVLLLAGANDIVPATGRSAQQVVSSITNIVAHIAANLPDTKIVVGNQINVEQGYNSGNYAHVTNMIPQVNTLLKNYVDNLPEALVGKVFLADLNSYVKSGEYGILFDHGSDHLHPDWWGHDQMAEGWLSVVTNQFTSTQTFPSATIPAAPTTEELGAAAKTELEAYRQGFKLARRIDAASNLDTANPYAASGDGVTENIEKVGYFVEYVRADNNAHKWVWVDMDAFGTTIGDVGLPTTNHQQVVTKLHVKSNHNGIDDIAADDDTVTGFIEFSPYDYNGNASGVTGAPTGNGSCCDWNDTLSESGSYGCMQVHRVFSPAKAAPDGITRGGQVLFAYNNWQSSSSTAEFGIGNFSSHFYRGASDAQTLDYTYTANAPKMNASAYSVKRIEIWTKTAEPPEVIPTLPSEATPEDVDEAIESMTTQFEDTSIAGMITGSDDPVAEYTNFKTWANTIEGGESAVVGNQYAAAAYVLGATALFENEPVVEISEAELNTDTCEMTLTVTVKDGEDSMVVASSKVKDLFEATKDLNDWESEAAKLEPQVTDLTEGVSDSLQFTVTPGDGTSPRAFLRIRK